MKWEQTAPQLLELLANDRQSQAGHMLNNLSMDSTSSLIREVSACICGKLKNQHNMNARLFLFFCVITITKIPKCYQTAVPLPDAYLVCLWCFPLMRQTDIYFNSCDPLFVVFVGGGGVCKPSWSGVSVWDALWTTGLYGVLLYRQWRHSLPESPGSRSLSTD